MEETIFAFFSWSDCVISFDFTLIILSVYIDYRYLQNSVDGMLSTAQLRLAYATLACSATVRFTGFSGNAYTLCMALCPAAPCYYSGFATTTTLHLSKSKRRNLRGA